MLFKKTIVAAAMLLAPVVSFAQATPVPFTLSPEQLAAVTARCVNGCVILSKEQADQLQETFNDLARKAFLAGTTSCKKDFSL